MKKLRYWLITFLFIVISSSFSTIVAYGDTNDIHSNITQTEEVEENTGLSENSTSSTSDVEQSGYMDDLKHSLEMNERLFGIYETWTAFISIILILVTIIGIFIPFYNNKKMDDKIEKAVLGFKEENEAILQKHVSINNALMLSASGEYWSSNEILKDLLKEDNQNSYLHLLIGRNIFLQYEGKESSPELNEEKIKEMETAIEHFLFVANNTSAESKYYELGVIFPDSIIHELCILTGELIDYSLEHNTVSNYHKLAVKVIKAIEKALNIKDFDDIANEDQTNVHIMNYIGLNHALAKSYAHFGNIRAREQYTYTLKLYSISSDLDYSEQIAECREKINSIKRVLQ